MVFLLVNCRAKSEKTESVNKVVKILSGNVKYDLINPTEKYFMPDELEEISGITYLDSDHFAAIQDEDGILFVYKVSTKKIEKKIKFGKKGDYEDLAVVGNRFYVLKSNGTLYSFEDTDHKSVDAMEIKTGLAKENDVEGLFFDKNANQFLLACKENPSLDEEESTKYKAIYSFDLKTNVLSPVFQIRNKTLKTFLVEKHIILPEEKLSFKPSGIAIHPLDHKIYIIASDGKLLLVLNEDGSFFEAIALPPKIYRQPEGICFSPDGTLYISSEGKSASGYILKFDYVK